MRRRSALCLLALAGTMLVAPAAGAADEQPRFVKDAEIVPSQVLPPAPADDSAAARAELDELRRIAAATDADTFARADYDFLHEDGTMFQVAIAPGFDLSKLPATARLLGEVRTDEAYFAAKTKNYFKRSRPWVLDPSLKTCSRDEKPQSSYPSGHATMAFAMGTVLSQALPELSAQIMARAKAYSEERLVCGMHFRADIEGGQTLGTAVALLMLRDPAFRADLDAARAELAAAHLTGAAN